MTTLSAKTKRLGRSLRARLILLLTVALFPLGAIGIYQTMNVVGEANVLAEKDLLSRTAKAASAEVALIRRAYGAAQALGTAAIELGPDTSTCAAFMETFVSINPSFSYAGYASADGTTVCAGGPPPAAFDDIINLGEMASTPRPSVSIERESDAPGRSILVAAMPIFDETGSFVGVTSLTTPHFLAETLLNESIPNLDLALVDGNGSVLTASSEIGVEIFESLNLRPSNLLIGPEGRTIATDQTRLPGSIAAIVPVAESGLYALGLWRIEDSPSAQPLFGTATPAFPVLMWLASLFVAYFAINALVLRHLGVLRRRMTTFSLENADYSRVDLVGAPVEVREIAHSYNAMVSRIVEDAAELERNVAEKETLLKEVHHRVKNNLQLIASMLNMQIRALPKGEAQDVLKRVQDRVMSLALIHRALYKDTQVDMVRVDEIIKDVVRNLVDVALGDRSPFETDMILEEVVLDPDQAVPLCLLVTEAVTNSAKYAANGDGQHPKLTIRLSETENGVVFLSVANTRAGRPLTLNDAHAGGLGNRLIEAFVSQLDGRLDITENEELYRLDVRFRKFGAPDTDLLDAAE